MGFIEELRRKQIQEQKKAEEMSARVYSEKKLRLEQLRQQKELEATLAARRDKSLEDYKGKARLKFEQSGLLEMLGKLRGMGAIYSHGATGVAIQDSSYRHKVIVTFERRETAFDRETETRNLFNIMVGANGQIVFEHGMLYRKIFFHRETISEFEWKKDPSILEDALGRSYKSPLTEVEIYKRNHYFGPPRDTTGQGPCLPGDSLISIPKGFTMVKNLKMGNLVWTVDRFGQKIQVPIISKTRRLVSKDHGMAHIALEDGRKLIVSPGHPTIDNKKLGSLKKRQILDGSKIVSLQILPYKEKYTYDILPSGDTGAYWANGILIGSTLSDQFRRIQVENKHDRQISWHSRLFA